MKTKYQAKRSINDKYNYKLNQMELKLYNKVAEIRNKYLILAIKVL